MTNDPLLLELNIALMPDQPLAERLALASQKMAKKYPARLVMAPHLTLYQVPLYVKDLEQAGNLLGRIAAETPAFSLAATEYLYNAGEASFEAGYATTDGLVAMQAEVIAALNPLRGGLLLQRDPSGSDMRRFLSQNDRQGDDVRSTGYWEVGDKRQGGYFRPHATLNWFDLGTEVSIADPALPPIAELSGDYPTLGMFALGPQGSCPQLLASYTLVPRSSTPA